VNSGSVAYRDVPIGGSTTLFFPPSLTGLPFPCFFRVGSHRCNSRRQCPPCSLLPLTPRFPLVPLLIFFRLRPVFFSLTSSVSGPRASFNFAQHAFFPTPHFLFRCFLWFTTWSCYPFKIFFPTFSGVFFLRITLLPSFPTHSSLLWLGMTDVCFLKCTPRDVFRQVFFGRCGLIATLSLDGQGCSSPPCPPPRFSNAQLPPNGVHGPYPLPGPLFFYDPNCFRQVTFSTTPASWLHADFFPCPNIDNVLLFFFIPMQTGRSVWFSLFPNCAVVSPTPFLSPREDSDTLSFSPLPKWLQAPLSLPAKVSPPTPCGPHHSPPSFSQL